MSGQRSMDAATAPNGWARTDRRAAVRHRRRRVWPAALAGVALAATVALTGCSGGGNDSASSGSAAQQPALGVADGGVARQPNQAAEKQAGQPAAPPADKAPTDLRVDQRAIVYTGSITVRVDKVNEAAARVTGIVTGAGGFIGADKRTSGGPDEQATLELRVPADKFNSVVQQIADLAGAKEEQRSVDTQDVTEETVDLEARIATQKARVDSGRQLLAQAKSLADLVMLESEVAKREADLASLEAKKRRLSDLTALSTITAVLLGRGAAVPGDDEPGGFLGGLQAGWDALVASLRVLLTVLGALLPWLIALGLPVLAGLWLVRRLRRGARGSDGRDPAGPAPVRFGVGPGGEPRPATAPGSADPAP